VYKVSTPIANIMSRTIKYVPLSKILYTCSSQNIDQGYKDYLCEMKTVFVKL